MAPEALDATVNLCNTESLKQIDVYALALVIWEIMRRCQLRKGQTVVLGGGEICVKLDCF